MTDTPTVPAAAVQIADGVLDAIGYTDTGIEARAVCEALAAAGWLHDPAGVAELEAENARLRGLLRGPDDPRMHRLSSPVIPERSPMSRDPGARAENHHGWVIQDNVVEGTDR